MKNINPLRSHRQLASPGLLGLLLLALCLNSGSAAWAAKAPATPSQWSAAVQKTYSGFKSMKATFSQTMIRGESGITDQRQGEFIFQKPLRVRWTTEAPFEEILVVTDNLIWQYDIYEEVIYKFPIEALDDKNAFLQVVFGLSSLEETFKIEIAPTGQGSASGSGGTDETGETGEADNLKGLTRLNLTPYAPTSSLKEAVLWLDPASALIRQMEILDSFGNINRIYMKTIEKNPKIPAGAFEFTPPDGVDIEDRTR